MLDNSPLLKDVRCGGCFPGGWGAEGYDVRKKFSERRCHTPRNSRVQYNEYLPGGNNQLPRPSFPSHNTSTYQPSPVRNQNVRIYSLHRCTNCNDIFLETATVVKFTVRPGYHDTTFSGGQMEITERDCQFCSWKISQTFGTGPSPIGYGGGGHGDLFPG